MTNLFRLSEMTIKNDNVLSHLSSFLQKMRLYHNFDEGMCLRVFVDADKDFCLFEGTEYAIGFHATDKKLESVINSQFSPVVVSFVELEEHVKKIIRSRFGV